MRVKFLRDWKMKRAGLVTDWPDGAANLLIRRGIVEAVETADRTSPECAMRPPAQPRKAARR